MNDRFFACTDCKTYVDACGRWCATALESPGVVKWKESMDVEHVLADPCYWDETSPALEGWRTKLIEARKFLVAHGGHHVVFLTDNDIWGMGERELLRWLEVGENPKWTPRHLTEILGVSRWEEAEAMIASNPDDWQASWWLVWGDEDAFREEFERQASARRGRTT